MDLNYDTIIKQEFPNTGDNLLQTLPNTDFNITVKSEPITDDTTSLVTIKSEPIYEPPLFTQTLSTINTEHLLVQQPLLVGTPTTVATTPRTTQNSTLLNNFPGEAFSTTSTDLLQTPMIPGDSFIIYELETPTTGQQTLTNNQQITKEISQSIPQINATFNTQQNQVTSNTITSKPSLHNASAVNSSNSNSSVSISTSVPSQHKPSTINTSNSNISAPVSSAPPPVLLNAKLRKRNKVVIPVNPIDKRTRYNIEGTTTEPLKKLYSIPDVKNTPKTLNTSHSSNVGNKKIINHLIKRKSVQKIPEESTSLNSNTTSPSKKSEAVNSLQVKEERLSPISSPSSEQITSDSTQKDTNLKDSFTMPASENTFKPIVLPKMNKASVDSQTEVKLDISTVGLKLDYSNSDKCTVALKSDSPVLLESKEIELPQPASNTELRVKCLCSLTAERSVSSEKDNTKLKSFFNEMFEETRRLSKKQQRKIKMTLLQAISEAEDLMEQGKCCGF